MKVSLYSLTALLRGSLFGVLILSLVVSCGAARGTKNSTLKPVEREVPTKSVERESGLRALESRFSGRIDSEIQELLKDAQKYLGAPYRYGGASSEGFDCSGFTLTVFEQNTYRLPRRSEEQAQTGDPIDVKEVKPGDLLFFATAGGSRVSHVGIVHDIGRDGEIKFIHASTSKGVIISSLNERYWNRAFLHAQRVL